MKAEEIGGKRDFTNNSNVIESFFYFFGVAQAGVF